MTLDKSELEMKRNRDVVWGREVGRVTPCAPDPNSTQPLLVTNAVRTE
jgi:hypothetical protein